jgi:hypothetical protein
VYPNKPFYETAPVGFDHDVDRFSEDGFLSPDFRISEDTVSQVVEDLTPHWYGEGSVLASNRTHDAWSFSPAVKQIAADPRILDLLEKLYGRKPIPFQTLNFAVGSEQKAHSDAIHFNTLPTGFVCGVWVALEDVDESSGPLHYYRGSHTHSEYALLDALGKDPLAPFPAMRDYHDHYEGFLDTVIARRGFEQQLLLAQQGQIFIWSAGLLHGGAPIKDTSRTRFSQVTHYFFDDCLYFTPRLSHPHLGNYWLRHVQNIGTGENIPHVLNGHPFEVHRPGRYRFDAKSHPIDLDKPGFAARALNRIRRLINR